MQKEGQHHSNTHGDVAFQYWRSVYGSYGMNAMIDRTQEYKQNDKEVTLVAFKRACHQCG